MVISDGIPAVPRNRISRNSVPNPSAEEKTSRNSVPRNRNRSKILEFPSEPFRGRKNISEFRSAEQKWKQNLGIPFRTLQRKRNNSEFHSEPFRRRENNSEQNAAAAVSDSTQSESSCSDRKNWFPQFILHYQEISRMQADRSILIDSLKLWLKDCSGKLHFFAEFRSVPFRSEPRNWLFCGTRNASE
jgi:hypothetical protein